VSLDPAWVVALTVGGGVCELVGIGLVVREISQDRALVRDLANNDPGDIPDVGPKSIPQGPISGFLRIDWDEMAQVNRKEFRSALDAAVTRLIEEDYERDKRLRTFLQRQLTGSISGRMTGVAFFAAGVCIAGLAQVLQVVAD
jgi:hypothetical protein